MFVYENYFLLYANISLQYDRMSRELLFVRKVFCCNWQEYFHQIYVYDVTWNSKFYSTKHCHYKGVCLNISLKCRDLVQISYNKHYDGFSGDMFS